MASEARFDPRRHLDLGRSLAHDSDDEARLRAAINRCYYGLFLIARDMTGITDQRDVHRRVAAALNREYPSIATNLGLMRHLREVADYQLLTRNERHRDWVANWQTFDRWATEALAALEALPERI